MTDLYEVLDDPPTPEQLELWEKTRLLGRTKYICRGVLLVSGFVLVTWLAARLIVYWWFERDFWGTPVMLAIGPPVGWLIFRDRWTKNEHRFLTARARGLMQADDDRGVAKES